jgi:hypothetical protein
MKVKYIGKEKEDFLVEGNDMDFTEGVIYEARPSKSRPEDCLVVFDDSGEDYLYPKNLFEIVEE